MSQRFDTAIVVGAGSFGTAIASILANNFKKVVLKVRSEDVYQSINDNSENSVYLPGLKLADNIHAALTWEEVDQLQGEKLQLIVSGLPTAGIADFYFLYKDRFTNYFEQGVPLVSLSKGIDPVTLELADDLFFDYFPKHRELITFLSGPSFAKEILEGQITLCSIAGRSKKVLFNIVEMMEANYFKLLPNYDVKGVLLGGALKNILAIAGGIIEGLGYNHNTRAAMITRGITEMLRYGKVYNARPETFYGLSGMGDLILTTTGGLSRNKQFGLEIAKGRSAKEVIESQRTVVEGYKTCKAAFLVAEKYEIHARIFQGLYKVLYENADPRLVIEGLMNVPSKFEVD